MHIGVGAKTGGLQTSTLAIGLAAAAIDFLENEALRDPISDARPPNCAATRAAESDAAGAGRRQALCSHDELRARANSFVLRATQAALAAAKGTGYVDGHPAGRWCREALFFLVWSCPQGVMGANLCELAGLADESGPRPGLSLSRESVFIAASKYSDIPLSGAACWCQSAGSHHSALPPLPTGEGLRQPGDSLAGRIGNKERQ